jgi:ketosteroid isomerase-like protein
MLCTVTGAIVLVALQAGTAAAPPTAAERDIREFEQKYNGAYAAHDLPTYVAHLAPDFVQWLPSGRTDNATYQQSWTRFISDDTYQETDVLFKRDGAWKVVYLHYSPAPKKAP